MARVVFEERFIVALEGSVSDVVVLPVFKQCFHLDHVEVASLLLEGLLVDSAFRVVLNIIRVYHVTHVALVVGLPFLRLHQRDELVIPGIKNSLELENGFDLLYIFNVVFRYSVLESLVSQEVFDHLLTGPRFLQTLAHNLQTNSVNAVDVLAPAHDAGSQELFLIKLLELLQVCIVGSILLFSELLDVKKLSIAIEVHLNENTRAAKRQQVRIFSDSEVCHSFFAHVRHLGVSFVGCSIVLNLQQVQYLLEQVDLLVLYHYTPCFQPPRAILVPFIVQLFRESFILRFIERSPLFRLKFSFMRSAIEDANRFDVMRQQELQHFERITHPTERVLAASYPVGAGESPTVQPTHHIDDAGLASELPQTTLLDGRLQKDQQA